MKKKRKQGGAREGAGRPPLRFPKKTVATRVSWEVRKFWDTLANKATWLEALIRRSKDFRDWKGK